MYTTIDVPTQQGHIALQQQPAIPSAGPPHAVRIGQHMIPHSLALRSARMYIAGDIRQPWGRADRAVHRSAHMRRIW